MTQPMDPMERQPGVRLEDEVKNPPEYSSDSSAVRDGRQNGADGTGEQVRGLADQAREQASDMADQARERAGEMADQARERADEMTDQAREAAGNVGVRAREMEERGREQASSGLESVAEQLRERAAGDGTTGELAEKAAMSMERTAGYLREHSASDMSSDIEAYVREHPMQGVAAAIVAGFVIGRVLR